MPVIVLASTHDMMHRTQPLHSTSRLDDVVVMYVVHTRKPDYGCQAMQQLIGNGGCHVLFNILVKRCHRHRMAVMVAVTTLVGLSRRAAVVVMEIVRALLFLGVVFFAVVIAITVVVGPVIIGVYHHGGGRRSRGSGSDTGSSLSVVAMAVVGRGRAASTHSESDDGVVHKMSTRRMAHQRDSVATCVGGGQGQEQIFIQILEQKKTKKIGVSSVAKRTRISQDNRSSQSNLSRFNFLSSLLGFPSH